MVEGVGFGVDGDCGGGVEAGQEVLHCRIGVDIRICFVRLGVQTAVRPFCCVVFGLCLRQLREYGSRAGVSSQGASEYLDRLGFWG